MSKMKMFKKISISFGKLPIFQKISLIYGGIFSISLIMLSIFISGSTSFFFSRLNQYELKEALNAVKEYILSGQEINENSINKIIINRMVEVNIICYNSETSKTSIISSSKTQLNEKFFDIFLETTDNKKKFNIIELDNQKFLYYKEIIVNDNNTYKIQTFRILHQEEKQLRFLYIVFMLANLIGIVASFTIGAYISKKMLNPIKNIRNTAKRISIEDLNRRIDVSGPNDELRDLAITFNEMIDRLDNSFKKQNRFISDASHELRTPIAVIQGYANLMDRWGKSDPDVLQESIDSIKSETEHMTKLIKKLLFLAKSDQNKNQIQKELINLKDICMEITKEIDVMDIKQKYEFLSTDEQINVYGDYNLIKQMIWTLIENSIKYTDIGKCIILELYKDDTYGYISVKDFGKGIPQEDIPYVFDRFYRVDKSRNKDIPGTGLGLSIAKWIAEQHDAKIRLFSQIDEGTNIIIVFKLKV